MSQRSDVQEEIFFDDPKFLPKEEAPLAPKGPLSWKDRVKDHANVFGLLRLVFGTTKDSSGRPNNVLLLVYVSIVVFALAYWWSTHRVVRHVVAVQCKPVVISSKVKSPRRRNPGVRSAIKKRKVKQQVRSSCDGASVNITVKAAAIAALPSAYYYGLLGMMLFVLLLYYGRRPETRLWLKNLLHAWRGGGSSPDYAEVASMIAEKVGVHKTSEDRDGVVAQPSQQGADGIVAVPENDPGRH